MFAFQPGSFQPTPAFQTTGSEILAPVQLGSSLFVSQYVEFVDKDEEWLILTR